MSFRFPTSNLRRIGRNSRAAASSCTIRTSRSPDPTLNRTMGCTKPKAVGANGKSRAAGCPAHSHTTSTTGKDEASSLLIGKNQLFHYEGKSVLDDPHATAPTPAWARSGRGMTCPADRGGVESPVPSSHSNVNLSTSLDNDSWVQ